MGCNVCKPDNLREFGSMRRMPYDDGGAASSR